MCETVDGGRVWATTVVERFGEVPEDLAGALGG